MKIVPLFFTFAWSASLQGLPQDPTAAAPHLPDDENTKIPIEQNVEQNEDEHDERSETLKPEADEDQTENHSKLQPAQTTVNTTDPPIEDTDHKPDLRVSTEKSANQNAIQPITKSQDDKSPDNSSNAPSEEFEHNEESEDKTQNNPTEKPESGQKSDNTQTTQNNNSGQVDDLAYSTEAPDEQPDPSEQPEHLEKLDQNEDEHAETKPEADEDQTENHPKLQQSQTTVNTTDPPIQDNDHKQDLPVTTEKSDVQMSEGQPESVVESGADGSPPTDFNRMLGVTSLLFLVALVVYYLKGTKSATTTARYTKLSNVDYDDYENGTEKVKMELLKKVQADSDSEEEHDVWRWK